MLRSYLKQMKTLVSIVEKMGRIIDPYNYYDVRLNARLAGIINGITQDKAEKKKGKVSKMKKLLSLLVVGLLVLSFGMCHAEDVAITPTPKLVYSPLLGDTELLNPGYTKGTITLTEGWNLVAMPVLPLKPYSVEEFIKDIGPKGDMIVPEATHWSIPVVAVYKNGRFERYPKEGVTYNMVPGEAYFVYAEYHGPRVEKVISYLLEKGTTPRPYEPWRPMTRVTIAGKPLDKPVSLNLDRGWNGVSVGPPITHSSESGDLKFHAQILFTLGQLSKELQTQDIKAERVIFWNAYKQEWEQHELPYKLIEAVTKYHPIEGSEIIPDMVETFDRDIEPGEGFFLLCEQNGLYIPTLSMEVKPEPPVPPLPPKPPVVEELVYKSGEVRALILDEYHKSLLPNQKFDLVIKGTTPEGGTTELHIPLLAGKNDDVDGQLANAVDGNIHTLGGVMKSYPLGDFSIVYMEVRTVDLVVGHFTN